MQSNLGMPIATFSVIVILLVKPFSHSFELPLGAVSVAGGMVHIPTNQPGVQQIFTTANSGIRTSTVATVRQSPMVGSVHYSIILMLLEWSLMFGKPSGPSSPSACATINPNQ